jgi:sn-glycerol 3-phosphate transport system substrate-binding protein
LPAGQAQTEIQWWHSMTAVNGEWVNDLAKDFNESQKDYKVVPTFKGSYDESMTAAIAAFRAGNAPHILQVFEVGTATMMASKGAIVPVGKIMKDAGYKFDPKAYIPGVAGYYTAPNGQMLSFPFNSSTTGLLLQQGRLQGCRPRPRRPPSPGPRWRWPPPSSRPPATSAPSPPLASAGRSWKASRPGTTSLSPPRTTASARPGCAAGVQFAAARAPHREPGQHGQERPVRLQGPRQRRRRHLRVGRVRHDQHLVGLYGNVAKNAKFAYGLAPLPYYPDVPARRRTP